MNIFYAPPEQVAGDAIELPEQEAHHAVRVLRYREGDEITVVDGTGGWYEGTVKKIGKDFLRMAVDRKEVVENPGPQLFLGMGIIKKRDRLEFAVEKAVELGASGINLFRSEHTVKENVRMDRLRSTALSAMKQSLRAHLPEIRLFESLEEMIDAHPDCPLLVAHPDGEQPEGMDERYRSAEKLLLVVGPEGGFSDDEMQFFKEQGGRTAVSLGKHRLRTETAAVALLSRFV